MIADLCFEIARWYLYSIKQAQGKNSPTTGSFIPHMQRTDFTI